MAVTHEQTATEEVINLPDDHALLVRDERGQVLFRVGADGEIKAGDSPIGSRLPTADQKAALDAAADPSAENAFATLADVGGGGGPQVIGPFVVAWDDAGLLTGKALFTCPIGTQVLRIWASVSTAWNGGPALADIGQFTSGDGGWVAALAPYSPPSWDMQVADTALGGEIDAATSTPGSHVLLGTYDSAAAVRINRADPVEIVVTQDGLPGGDDPGASAGAADIYALVQYPA